MTKMYRRSPPLASRISHRYEPVGWCEQSVRSGHDDDRLGY